MNHLAIETNQLTKQYGSTKVVQSLNLHVPVGSVYGFIGKNGAGKTTTISMLVGLKHFSEGTIKILGESIHFNDLEYKKHIGFVSDVPEFYTWMNAFEYLTFCGKLYNLNPVDLKVRINELLDFVGLKGVKKPISTYSRGMRQRLGIAQSLIHDPKIVILDEPTSALDPIGRKDVMDIILKLKGRVTVFYSTHILSDVERVCDYVGIIDQGKLLVEDSLVQLKERYLNTRFILQTNKDLLSILESTSWIKNVEYKDDVYLLDVLNEQQACLEIPKLLHENNASLLRFERLEQTLEDIFLKVVNGNDL